MDDLTNTSAKVSGGDTNEAVVSFGKRCLNKVMLIGNLSRDPELRFTSQGTPVCTFGMATNRYWTTDSGERKDEVEWHRIVVWRKLAEICAKILFKGRRVYIEGRLQTRSWTGQDGQERRTTEIVAHDMLVLDDKHKTRGFAGGADIGDVNVSTSTGTPPTTAAANDVQDVQIEENKGVKEAEETNKTVVEAGEEKDENKKGKKDLPF